MGSGTRRAAALLAAAALTLTGCGGEGDGSATRTVLVDHSSDEFATFSLYNFPDKVTVRRGDVVEFKQTWTGEPHTVTGGTAVDETLRKGAAWVDFFEGFEALGASGAQLPNPDDPGAATVGDFAKAIDRAADAQARDQFVRGYEGLAEGLDLPLPPLDESSSQPFAELVTIVDEESEKFFASLPPAFDEDDNLAQNVSQPCYLEEGGPPEDPAQPCDDADQRQPAFDGRQSYYNSGVIPYEGERSNTFRVEVADDAELGSFLFYCAIHGLTQRSEVEIVAADADIPSQSTVNREIRDATNELTEGLEKIYRDAEDDNEVAVPGTDEILEGPFAGLPGEEHTAINEFLPKLITVKAGDPITWKMMGTHHTISFNVPRYFPIMEFLDDGTVRINPKLEPPAGGAVEYVGPERGPEEGPPPEEPDGPPTHDGGAFDGDGFWSSGLISGEPYLEYTMRITKPGTYSYACLLHPPMVGQVKVT